MKYADALKAPPQANGEPSSAARELRRMTHKTIAGVTTDIQDRLGLNTSIAKIMELVNEMYRFTTDGDITAADFEAFRDAVQALLHLLSPMAPHLSEELWETIGGEGLIMLSPWPIHDPQWLQVDTVKIAVQVNGKVRGTVEVAAGADQDAVWQAALDEPNINRWIENKEPRKKIYVPGKLMNVVL